MMASSASAVLPVWRSPMISSRCPRPIGIIASTALMPVCIGSLTGWRATTPGASRSTGLNCVVCMGPLPSIGEVVAMDYFYVVKLLGLDLGGVKAGDAAGKFGAVEVANSHYISGGKLPLAPRDARRQQALAPFAQGLPGPRVHKQRALGMVEKGNPALAALQPGWPRHEQG